MPTIRDLLLTRHGQVFIPDAPRLLHTPGQAVDGAALELASIGYVLSTRLMRRLASLPSSILSEHLGWMRAALLGHLGADQTHIPLFRRFPEDVPADTQALWWKKVLSHYLQASDQPCIFCGGAATTHVLAPCCHVVCDLCFDGGTYSACPVCEHHVDRTSPFFRESPVRGEAQERVRFKRLDLCEDADQAAQELLALLCRRKQAMSPDDRAALVTLVGGLGLRALDGLPQPVPVRENEALVLGTLLSSGCPPEAVLAAARGRLRSATDVLRVIAVMSGEDGSLQPVLRRHRVHAGQEVARRFPGYLGAPLGSARQRSLVRGIPMRVRRFKVVRLSRPLRRALLLLLDGLEASALVEDMLSYRSCWVAVGERLHPHEHASRHPKVAHAFAVVRGKAPDGTRVPRPVRWRARVEAHLAAGEGEQAAELLAERPGELARRLDHLLRSGEAERILALFLPRLPRLATPMLLTLKGHLRQRLSPAAVRVYWPKGQIGRGVSSPDRRPVLSADIVERALQAIDAELLNRLGRLPHFRRAWVDVALHGIVVPFNERTASSAAVSMPRGSRLALPSAPALRLMLHWCQPERGGSPTDLDLSVGLYAADWSYRGVCSYYELQCRAGDGRLLAMSAGDLRDAPWPEGATELVDVHLDALREEDIRYVVMVVNAYSGLAFGELERAFAGVMLRDDLGGALVDPRTVALRFNLAGDHGTYLPLVVDVRDGVLHWLDVHARGALRMNNVATSNHDIQRICPELMSWFASGTRVSMGELALLHAAARCEEITLRGPQSCLVRREPGESAEHLYRRLQQAAAAQQGPFSGEAPGVGSSREVGPIGDEPVLALLLHGDLSLPAGSAAYALFREHLTCTLAASDLIV